MKKIILFTLILILFSFILLANEREKYVELFRNIYEVENDEFDELFEFWADAITFANNYETKDRSIPVEDVLELMDTYDDKQQQRLRYLEWLIHQKYPSITYNIFSSRRWDMMIDKPYPIKRYIHRPIPLLTDFFIEPIELHSKKTLLLLPITAVGEVVEIGEESRIHRGQEQESRIIPLKIKVMEVFGGEYQEEYIDGSISTSYSLRHDKPILELNYYPALGDTILARIHYIETLPDISIIEARFMPYKIENGVIQPNWRGTHQIPNSEIVIDYHTVPLDEYRQYWQKLFDKIIMRGGEK
jgi:hypothetical protein